MLLVVAREFRLSDSCKERIVDDLHEPVESAHEDHGDGVCDQHAHKIRAYFAEGLPVPVLLPFCPNLLHSGFGHIPPVKHTVTGEDMNRRSATKALATVLAASLTLSLAACGGSSSKSSDGKKASHPSTASQARAIVSGTTTYTIDPGAAARLKAAGVTLTPTAPGKGTPTTIVVPANGGRIVVKSLIGSVHSAVGLTFAKGATKVTFTNVAFNTESRKVTGNYNGNRIAIFQLRLKNLATGKGADAAIVATGINLVYARGAVALVNKTLKVNALKTKQAFGTATFTVVAKKTSAASTTKKTKKTKSKKKTSSTTTTTTTTSTK